MNTQEKLKQLCHFYEHMQPNDISRFSDFYADNACFKDPFHQVNTLTDIQTIFTHMFKVAPDSRFFMHQRFVQGNTAMVIWEMQMTVAKRALQIQGTTYFEFNDAGLVIVHRDYWDTGEELFAKLPIIGAPTRWLLRQLSAIKI
jgi:steroid delta-isomerase